MHVGQPLKGEDVVAVMTRLHQQVGVVPERIQVSNSSEFISKTLDCWAHDYQVTLDFPGQAKFNCKRVVRSPLQRTSQSIVLLNYCSQAALKTAGCLN